MKTFGKKAAALVIVAIMTMTSLVGCIGVDDSKVVATVGDNKITAGLANFYMRLSQSSIESTYASYYGEDFWSMELEEGVTFEENMKESAMETLQELYLLQDHMGEYEVSLSEDELAAIDAAAESFVKANKDDVKELVSGGKDTVVEYLTLITIANKMSEAMIADVDREVSDEEAAQKKMSYVAFDKVVTAEDGSTTKLTDDEVAVVKQDAEAFLAAAKDNGNITEYATSVSKEATDLTFDAESTALDEAVITAADALEEGAFAEMIETENAYYVLQLVSTLDREATDAEKENIVAERENARYTELVDQWREETKIEVNDKVWDKLSFEAMKVSAKAEETEETEQSNSTETTEDATTDDTATAE